MIRVALFRGKSLISRAIQWQTRSPYSHAAFLLPDGRVLEAWHQGGVRCVAPNDGHEKGTIIELYTVEGLNPARSDLALRFAMAQVGKEYDFSSVFRFVSRRQERRAAAGKWFCSELVFAALQKGGVNVLDRIQPWAVSPGMLACSPRLLPAGTLRI